jgi:hypothetical protein
VLNDEQWLPNILAQPDGVDTNATLPFSRQNVPGLFAGKWYDLADEEVWVVAVGKMRILSLC